METRSRVSGCGNLRCSGKVVGCRVRTFEGGRGRVGIVSESSLRRVASLRSCREEGQVKVVRFQSPDFALIMFRYITCILGSSIQGLSCISTWLQNICEMIRPVEPLASISAGGAGRHPVAPRPARRGSFLCSSLCAASRVEVSVRIVQVQREFEIETSKKRHAQKKNERPASHRRLRRGV